MIRGWALAQSGEAETGLAQLQQGLAGLARHRSRAL